MITKLNPQLACAIEAIMREPADELVRVKCAALMEGYHNHWHDAPYTPIEVETEFQLPIIDTKTGRVSKTWRINPDTGKREYVTWTQAGKFDGIVELGGRPYLLEHKTASEDITDPDSVYWRRLVIDSQVSMYAVANWQNERLLAGTVYDVIRKPTIRPKEIPQKDRRAITSLGKYFDNPVSEADKHAIASGRTSETPTLYALRLAADIRQQPQKYFQRRPVPRLQREMLEWAGELTSTTKDIQLARRNGTHYRNTGGCVTYGTPCEFLGICSGHDDPDSDKWRKRETRHSELETIDDGPDNSVITHSRIRTFATCRRKHFYRYELGIEHADREPSAALTFGRILHAGLEAWFTYQLKGTDHGDDFAVNEIAKRPELPQSNPNDRAKTA